ncbi:hypothetical protein RI367_007413 [Sorochytrium milnesiophthora]
MDPDLARIAARYQRLRTSNTQPLERQAGLALTLPSSSVKQQQAQSSPGKSTAVPDNIVVGSPVQALSSLSVSAIGSPTTSALQSPSAEGLHFSTPYAGGVGARRAAQRDLTLSLSPVAKRGRDSGKHFDLHNNSGDDDPYGFVQSERQVREILLTPSKSTTVDVQAASPSSSSHGESPPQPLEKSDNGVKDIDDAASHSSSASAFLPEYHPAAAAAEDGAKDTDAPKEFKGTLLLSPAPTTKKRARRSPDAATARKRGRAASPNGHPAGNTKRRRRAQQRHGSDSDLSDASSAEEYHPRPTARARQASATATPVQTPRIKAERLKRPKNGDAKAAVVEVPVKKERQRRGKTRVKEVTATTTTTTTAASGRRNRARTAASVQTPNLISKEDATSDEDEETVARRKKWEEIDQFELEFA